MDGCLNCGTPLAHFEGRRKKVFCSAKCRVSFNRKKGKPETITIKRTEYDKLVACYSSASPSEINKKEPEYIASVDPYSTDSKNVKNFVYKKAQLEEIADKKIVNPKSLNQKEEEVPKWNTIQRVPKPPSNLSQLQKIAWVADWKSKNQ